MNPTSGQILHKQACKCPTWACICKSSPGTSRSSLGAAGRKKSKHTCRMTEDDLRYRKPRQQRGSPEDSVNHAGTTALLCWRSRLLGWCPEAASVHVSHPNKGNSVIQRFRGGEVLPCRPAAPVPRTPAVAVDPHAVLIDALKLAPAADLCAIPSRGMCRVRPRPCSGPRLLGALGAGAPYARLSLRHSTCPHGPSGRRQWPSPESKRRRGVMIPISARWIEMPAASSGRKPARHEPRVG